MSKSPLKPFLSSPSVHLASSSSTPPKPDVSRRLSKPGIITKSGLSNLRLNALNLSSQKSGAQTSRVTSRSNDGSFASTREQMIARYNQLADQYRAELERRDQLIKEKKAIQTEIASIFIQSDRIDELIKKVKDKNNIQSND